MYIDFLSEFAEITKDYMSTYRKVRADLNAEKAFPDVYEKISALGRE